MSTRQEFQTELAQLIEGLIPSISDEYRAYDDPDSTIPSMLLTIGVDEKDWSYQTGDTSYSGGAYFYPHWGSVIITRDDDPVALAEEILLDLEQDLEPEDKVFYDNASS